MKRMVIATMTTAICAVLTIGVANGQTPQELRDKARQLMIQGCGTPTTPPCSETQAQERQLRERARQLEDPNYGNYGQTQTDRSRIYQGGRYGIR